MCVKLGVLGLGFEASPSNSLFSFFDLAYGFFFCVFVSFFNTLFHLIMVTVLSSGHLKKPNRILCVVNLYNAGNQVFPS